jgi:hypothetical protein
VYAVPFESPETVIGEAAAVPVMLPGVEVAIYEVIAALPELLGAEKVTDAVASPAVAVPIVGAPGTVGHSPCFCQ